VIDQLGPHEAIGGGRDQSDAQRLAGGRASAIPGGASLAGVQAIAENDIPLGDEMLSR